LNEGEAIELLRKPARVVAGSRPSDLVIRHLDEHIVVVEKVSGINTVRHPAEREWADERRSLSPTLEDLTQQAIAETSANPKRTLPRLRIVHRLDKETSGLVVFARSVLAERLLGKQFHAHSVIRRYQAIVRGYLPPQTIETKLVRDRGDGRRGSGSDPSGKIAITHLDVIERLPHHTLLMCQLETGRTHQIRIHLAESDHPVCGEQVYNRAFKGDPIPDPDDAPRLALHAFELGFEHPESHETVFWDMPLPPDLRKFLDRLRRSSPKKGPHRGEPN
jgi:23S rRNA pseudouridine1911/1915/1917 synthase